MRKPGHAYRLLKLVHIDYVREDEFSIINVKTSREILSKYIESYGKKVADRSFHMQSDNNSKTHHKGNWRGLCLKKSSLLD